MRHTKTIAHIIGIVSKNPDVLQMYLFGSCARGEEKYSSDVDLLLVVSDSMSGSDIRKISLDCFVDDLTLPDADIVVYKESTLAESSFFISQVKKDWRLIYENVS